MINHTPLTQEQFSDFAAYFRNKKKLQNKLHSETQRALSITKEQLRWLERGRGDRSYEWLETLQSQIYDYEVKLEIMRRLRK